MDINTLGITGVAAITVICLLVGQAVKASRCWVSERDISP